MNILFSCLILLSTSATVFAQTGPEVATYFKERLSDASTVFLPSESNYTLETTQRWNAFSAPTYIVSVKPATDLDVQKIVGLFATSKNQSLPKYQYTTLTLFRNRSHTLMIIIFHSLAQVVGTATQQLWVRSRAASKSTLATSILSPSTKMPIP